MRQLIYWDSAAFLAHFQREKDRFELCENTLKLAESGSVGIITSTLAIAECLWLRGQDPIPRDRAEIIRRFFRRSFIRVRNVTRHTSELAQELVWDFGIRPKDAIHVATALEANASVIETFDGPFIAKSGKVGTPPLIIREPLPPTQGALFT